MIQIYKHLNLFFFHCFLLFLSHFLTSELKTISIVQTKSHLYMWFYPYEMI